MSENKHTPWPWRADLGLECLDGDLSKRVIYIQDSSGGIVASVHGHTSERVTQKNALLLATAPDLLAACKVALTWYEHPAMHDAFRGDKVLYDHLNTAIERARAALAAAE